jgi:hypothetical protein
VRNQTQTANRQTLDDAWRHQTMSTTKKDRHNQREKKVAQNNANRRRKRKKKGSCKSQEGRRRRSTAETCPLERQRKQQIPIKRSIIQKDE